MSPLPTYGLPEALSGLILATYYMRYPYTVPFLRSKTSYSLLKRSENNASLGGSIILNPLTLED